MLKYRETGVGQSLLGCPPAKGNSQQKESKKMDLLGSAGPEDSALRPVWAKSSQDPILANIKLSVVVCAYHLSY
jgi:hypothetical protein